jgi:hypothetical protein
MRTSPPATFASDATLSISFSTKVSGSQEAVVRRRRLTFGKFAASHHIKETEPRLDRHEQRRGERSELVVAVRRMHVVKNALKCRDGSDETGGEFADDEELR